MRRFRLLGGGHSEKYWVDAKPEDKNTTGLTLVRDPFTGKETLRRLVSKRYDEPGDVIETENDLVKLFGVNKFEEIYEDSKPAMVHDDGRSLKLMERMRVEDLRKYAEEEEIDLGDAGIKKDIIQKILDGRTLAAQVS
jgi:hypothetical protein